LKDLEGDSCANTKGWIVYPNFADFKRHLLPSRTKNMNSEIEVEIRAHDGGKKDDLG
jgi:hypothetical protein